MKFIPANIPEVILIEPEVFDDKRGFFFESYNREVFSKNGIPIPFVQDNHSRSSRGTLRGLHFQIAPYQQAKLVRVIRGEAFDVVVDVRQGSKTFGQYVAVTLSAENKKMLYVPVGFAHGFLALQDGTEFHYKASSAYSPQHERGFIWNDSMVNVLWPKLDIEYTLSEKDQKYPRLFELKY